MTYDLEQWTTSGNSNDEATLQAMFQVTQVTGSCFIAVFVFVTSSFGPESKVLGLGGDSSD